jgi:anti-sigma factor RsiW
MNCAWVRDRLLLYLGEELCFQEAVELCAHLESCARCTTEAEELAETLDLVERGLRTTASAPPTLDARVMAAVRQLPARRQWTPFAASWSGGRRLAAAAAALGLLIGGYSAGRWHAGRNGTPAPAVAHTERPLLALELLGDDHLKYLANPQPAQIPGPDPREVALGLMPLLNFPVAAVDLQPEGARLLGGRKCEVHGVPIAFLLYDWKGERVSLYQIDGRKIALPPLREVTLRGQPFLISESGGLGYVAWHSGAMNFVMVSGASPERLLQLARCASGMSDRV